MNRGDASPDAIRVMGAMTDYQAAEQAMRRRTRESMRMGEADLRALRFLLRREVEGRPVTPADLASALGIKSSSVTVMLDRLTASGHVRRSPNPTDRRSLVITATPGADEEVRQTLGEMHARMLAVAASLDEGQATAVTTFLRSLTDTLHELDRSET